MNDGAGLAIRSPTVLKPPGLVAPLRVVVSPMYHPTLRVPFVFAIEGHRIAPLQSGNSWREVNIVRNQHRMPRREGQNESLVPRPLVVIGQNFLHDPNPFQLAIAGLITKRPQHRLAARFGLVLRGRWAIELTPQ